MVMITLHSANYNWTGFPSQAADGDAAPPRHLRLLIRSTNTPTTKLIVIIISRSEIEGCVITLPPLTYNLCLDKVGNHSLNIIM